MVVWVVAEYLALHFTMALPIAFTVHVVSWVAQFMGHGVFEGRAPALLESLAQSFFMAPLFVILEAFSWAGYKKALFAQLKSEVRDNIGTLRSKSM